MKNLIISYIIASIIASTLVSCNVLRRDIIESRGLFAVVEVAIGEVSGTEKDGRVYGYRTNGTGYIGYGLNEELEAGDKVMSILLYNPLNNWCDDIIGRWDIAVWN